jgi:hypothetical protein
MNITEFIDWLNRDAHWMYVIIALWLAYRCVIGIIYAIGEAVAKSRGYKSKRPIEYRYGRTDDEA